MAAVQALAWCCRIGVVFCTLAAFGLPATVPLAAVVMVLCGVSTLVPITPGGAGTQQVMLAYALRQSATAPAALAFSVGLQAGVTVVNALLGAIAPPWSPSARCGRWPRCGQACASRAPAERPRARGETPALRGGRRGRRVEHVPGGRHRP